MRARNSAQRLHQALCQPRSPSADRRPSCGTCPYPTYAALGFRFPQASATDLSRVGPPALRYIPPRGEPADFGDFTVTTSFLLEDRITGNTGICAEVANATLKRILIDPKSWLVRSGNNAYRVRTVDFVGALDPSAHVRIFFVLETGVNGMPVELAQNEPVQISARVAEKSSARPVSTIYDVEPLLPRVSDSPTLPTESSKSKGGFPRRGHLMLVAALIIGVLLFTTRSRPAVQKTAPTSVDQAFPTRLSPGELTATEANRPADSLSGSYTRPSVARSAANSVHGRPCRPRDGVPPRSIRGSPA